MIIRLQRNNFVKAIENLAKKTPTLILTRTTVAAVTDILTTTITIIPTHTHTLTRIHILTVTVGVDSSNSSLYWYFRLLPIKNYVFFL